MSNDGQNPSTDLSTVGETALRLPSLGFGTAHLGELYEPVNEQDSLDTLNAAWEAGVRYYDTAPWYGRGLAEHRLGGFLRTKEREEFSITTKVGRTLHRPDNPASFDRAPWQGGLDFEVRYDYSHDGILRAYEQSLQRLALNTVDALLIHDLDHEYFEQEQYDVHRGTLLSSGVTALQELKASGDIKAIGMGINTTEALETLASEVELDFVLVAMPYTLLDQSSFSKGMAMCEQRGISVVIGAPFASGILATGSKANAFYRYQQAPTEILSKVKQIESICAKYQVALPAAALQFVLAHPSVVSTIPGSVNAEQARANASHMHTSIAADFWAELKQTGLLEHDVPVPG